MMSSSSKSSRAGYESSKSSDDSRLSRVSKSRSHKITACDEEIIIPFHRLDSPEPVEDHQQQTPQSIAFKATLSTAFVAAPVQLTESSSQSCATSTAGSSDHGDSMSISQPSKQRPGTRMFKPQINDRGIDGEPQGLFDTFVSPRGINKDAESGGASGTSPRTRPNSANSIVNVMKIVTSHTAEATQLIQKHFNICGSSNENEYRHDQDLQKPFKFMSLSGKASPKDAQDPTIVHESIEYPFISSSGKNSCEVFHQRSSMEEIPFQRSSGSAFGRVGSDCSLQNVSEMIPVNDPMMYGSRLRSSRGGPSLFLSSSASDVSSSCSGTSTSITKDLSMHIPASQRGDHHLSSISARAQLSIKNKRRQKRQRDSKSRSSLVPSITIAEKSSLPQTEQSQGVTLASVDEENISFSNTIESYDIDILDQAQNDDEYQQNLQFETSYVIASDDNFLSLPVYYKLEDDDHDIVKVTRSNRSHGRKKSSTQTPRRHEAIVLPLPHYQSPNSVDGSQSPLTIKSFNTSIQSTNSGLSVGSSVIAADREVMEVNRSRLRQSKMNGGDVDGSMSIHSSDSASTHAYATLVNGSFPREGASLHADQLFQIAHVSSENGHGRGIYHDSSSNSVANKSSSSDESQYGNHHQSFMQRLSGEGCDDIVVSYSKLRSSCENKLISAHSIEDKMPNRSGLSEVEASPTSTDTSRYFKGASNLVKPVSPPSHFVESHPVDYLHQKGASKPSVVRRYDPSEESSLREKIDFFSKNTVWDSSPIPTSCTKNRFNPHCYSKTSANTKGLGQGPSHHDAPPNPTESSYDPYPMISPDK